MKQKITSENQLIIQSMNKIIIFILTIFFTLSCSNNDEQVSVNNTPNYPININPIIIHQGGGGIVTNNPNQHQMVFNNQNDWDQFKSNNWLASSYIPETNIDCNLFTPIICFDTWKGTPGYYVTISSVQEFENNIKIVISYTGNGAQNHFPTLPHIVFKIPKTTKPIIFE